MQKRKRIINVRVKDASQLIALMEKLGKLEVDLVAESRPRAVKIELFGSKEEARGLEHKIMEFLKNSQSS
ncbi:MAG: hypothetical protein ACETWO_02330 [Candidatus Hadarchaeaceae archaeon]|nr:hypothetical protein [Hadesarchaea archaeon]MDH5685896.1 hypothetical protein [Hadesarchaea archaeon]